MVVPPVCSWPFPSGELRRLETSEVRTVKPVSSKHVCPLEIYAAKRSHDIILSRQAL